MANRIESAEERQERLRRRRERYRIRRERETGEERESRLARRREYDRIKRGNMNEQQREAALQQRRERQWSVSSTERLARREQDRLRRETESDEQREARHPYLIGDDNHEDYWNEDDIVEKLEQEKADGNTVKVSYTTVLFCGLSDVAKTILLKLKEKMKRTGLTTSKHAILVKKTAAIKSTDSEILQWTNLDYDLINLNKQLPKLGFQLPVASLSPKESLPKNSDKSLGSLQIPSISLSPASSVNIPSTARSESAFEKQEFGVDIAKADPSSTPSPGDVWNIINFLDTGGQPEFINTLPAVSSSIGITFIVFNLSKSLDSPVHVQCDINRDPSFEPYYLDCTNLEFIKHLMVSSKNFNKNIPALECIQRKDGENDSKICYMGTHALNVSTEKIKEIDDELSSIASELKVHQRSFWSSPNPQLKRVFPVNMFPPDENEESLIIEDIRDNIEKLVKKRDYCEVPYSWFIFLLKLQELCTMKKISYISYQEAVGVWVDVVSCQHKSGAKLSQNLQEDQNESVSQEQTEIHNILLYFHFKGMLFYFHKVKGMHDLVFTDCQWLFKKLTELVEIKFTKGYNRHTSAAVVEKFIMEGRLNISVIKTLKMDLQGIQPSYFIHLLEHLNIIAPIDAKHKDYFMPCVLPSFPLNKSAKKFSDLEKLHGTIQHVPLLVGFKNVGIPYGFFCQLIVELCRNLPTGWIHPLMSTEEMQHFFNNLFTFPTTSGHAVSLFYKIGYIEIQVRHKRSQSSIIHYNVQRELDKILTKVSNRLQLNKGHFCYGFYCDCEDIQHFARLEEFTSSIEYISCGHIVTKLIEDHRVWLQEISNSNQSTTPTGNGPTMQKLLSYLQVLNNWETFGYLLLPKDKGYLVEMIKKDNQGVEACKAALYKEFLKCGVVTWDTVINALEKSNELNLAKQVKMKVQDLNLNVTPSLRSLYQYITPHFATKWKAIGMQLGLPNEVFVEIEAEYSTNSKWCCNQMLEKWLDVDTTASWDKLLMAIESPAVSECSEKVTSILDQLIIDKGKDECITQSNWVRKRYVQMKCKCDKEAWSSEMFTLLALVHERNGSNKFTTKPEEIVSLLNPVLKHSGLFKDSVTKKVKRHEDPKYILIEGVPGIGKTCLVKHITYLWAEEQIPVLENFKLLLLLFMQDPVVQQMSDLKQLLQLFWESNAEVTSACMHYLFKSGGKDIVFLLDGFDELPALQEGSIIDDLLKRKLLPHCHLIVTSRPRVSSILHHHANVRVDILGLSDNDRHSYIETVLGDQPDKISELTHYLSSHKLISSLCYTPLNLTILLYLYNHKKFLPKNSAELYHSFVCLAIQHHLAKYVTRDITKLTDLPEPYNKRVQQLSKLSFDALIDKKWSFTLDQIKGACSDIDGVFDGCGLLQEVQHFSQCRTYNFIHSSIQEYLAAYHISTLSAKEEFKIFEEEFWNDDFLNVFSMYITLTKGQQPTFKKFLSDKEISISCKFLDDRFKSFRLYHYFCEADCIEMGNSFKQLEAFMSKGIYLAQTRLTTVDIQCIALFLASSSHKEWTEINLHGCDIQDYGIHILHRELHALSSIHIMTLQLSYNGLTEAASSLISDIIIKCKVKELWINGNHFIGEHQEFYSMLTNSVTLESLYLIDIQLSSQAAFSIFKALMHNNTLKELIITNNNISDDVCISITRALQNNSSLVKLWMWDNPIHSETLVLILKALQDNNTLALLGFPNCPEKTKMELESLQVDVNKKRENHGCQVKLVIDFM